MKTRLIAFIVLTVILFAGFGCTSNSPLNSKEKNKIENLEAFAKMYGYVRYFHPSDEANSINWNKFLFHGIEQVSEVKDPTELKQVLENLFSPIAPTIDIYLAKDKPKPLSLNNKTDDKVLVTWQHKGMGFNEIYPPYRSIRLGRTEISDSVNYILKEWPIEDYGNKNFELFIKGEVSENTSAKIRMTTFKGYTSTIYSEVIKGGELNKKLLSGTFPEGTAYLSLSIGLIGEGSIKVEDLELVLPDSDGNSEVLLDTHNQWKTNEKENSIQGWMISGFGYDYEIEKDNNFSYLQIRSKKGVTPGSLFEKHANINDVITKDLGKGISCRIPLALYLQKEKPTQFSSAFNDLNNRLEKIQIEDNTAQLAPTRIGAVISTWSLFNHFYPYLDVIEADWGSILTTTLENVLQDRNTEECLFTLLEMTSHLQDGHVSVWHPIDWKRKRLPILFDYIENQIVVLQSNNTSIKRGDILMEIDGKPASEVFTRFYDLTSGSPHGKENLALYRLTFQDSTTVSKLKFKRSGEILNVSVDRKGQVPDYNRPDKISMIKEGIFYVDLDRASMADIDERIHEIAESKGVIFDLRGYPNANHDIIDHLIDAPVKSPRYHTPQLIYPDLENIVSYDTSQRHSYQPSEPRIKGNVVFLTDETAQSYAESVMSIIEHYKLADIVGSPTSGANGNVNYFFAMGGFTIPWTGMKVLKHDYSQHHSIGIQPTVLVKPTLKGIREGRDEVLDKAVEILSK